MYGLTTFTIWTGINSHVGYLRTGGTLEDHQYGEKIGVLWDRLVVVQLILSIALIVLFEGIYRFNRMSEDPNITPKLKE